MPPIKKANTIFTSQYQIASRCGLPSIPHSSPNSQPLATEWKRLHLKDEIKQMNQRAKRIGLHKPNWVSQWRRKTVGRSARYGHTDCERSLRIGIWIKVKFKYETAHRLRYYALCHILHCIATRVEPIFPTCCFAHKTWFSWCFAAQRARRAFSFLL